MPEQNDRTNQSGTATGASSGRGSNLTQADRKRGGEESAEMQDRDETGRFAGKREGEELNGSPPRAGTDTDTDTERTSRDESRTREQQLGMEDDIIDDELDDDNDADVDSQQSEESARGGIEGNRSQHDRTSSGSSTGSTSPGRD